MAVLIKCGGFKIVGLDRLAFLDTVSDTDNFKFILDMKIHLICA